MGPLATGVGAGLLKSCSTRARPEKEHAESKTLNMTINRTMLFYRYLFSNLFTSRFCKKHMTSKNKKNGADIKLSTPFSILKKCWL
jgi:hypothetical protein